MVLSGALMAAGVLAFTHASGYPGMLGCWSRFPWRRDLVYGLA